MLKVEFMEWALVKYSVPILLCYTRDEFHHLLEADIEVFSLLLEVSLT